jgi:fatty-acyl-CoA synthase
MRGLMMDYQLTLRHILDRSFRFFPRKEVVTRVGDGVTRASYEDVYGRVHRLAGALRSLGVERGDRVGTFAWNNQRHLEVYFAAPCMGAVLHTVNFRLFQEQITYIVNHAEDRVLFVDPSVLHLLEPIADRLDSVRHYVVLGDPPDDLSNLAGRPVHSYESLLESAPEQFPFPDLGENDAAAMCYTSGTTGNPKGVLYSHRALVLHSLGEATADVMALSEGDVVLPVVPMFHANAWGLPFTSTMVGATQVLPGAAPTPADLIRLIETEGVTIAAGVPTLWMGVLAALDQGKHDVSSVTRIMCGGSAAPPAMIEAYEKRHGVPVWHAWGMAEMTPLGTVSRLKRHLERASPEERLAIRSKQGIASALVDLKAIDDEGNDVPWDGKSLGELVVRGPWVTAGYYRDPDSAERFTSDGWFRTGDVVTIDAEGYLQIADRTKDLVKSGGEWISSVELENALMAHPSVAEAAVIAVPDARWGERPLACVVLKREGGEATEAEMIDFLRPRFASWWLPDSVRFVDEIPKTSVGKFDKKVLRDRYQSGGPVN